REHIFDSLVINLFIPQGKNATLLDFGTGGGFPAVPLAIANSSLKITALDSIQKKITAVENIKQQLNLKNIETICTRVENFDKEFDYVTSRAVSSLNNILKYACKKLKKGGYFIAFKSSKLDEELEEAKNTLKKLPIKQVKIIDYKLPIENPPIRKLIIFKKI
ncbi:MAG: 16S rRNA (guanine(527)-N(7))-methyltransferase RsmG, partial [bacterium]|nr:16S rRNA (guanine(527)-N(7))-methyltransferase RsmG [bacterium]